MLTIDATQTSVNFEPIYYTVQVCTYGKGTKFKFILNIPNRCYTAVLYLNSKFAVLKLNVL